MKTPPSSRSFFLLCAGAFFLVVVLVALGSHRMGLPFLPVDDFDGVPYPRHPGVAVAETAKHFWRTGSLERPEFSQIRDWCRRQSLSDTGTRYTPDVYAVAHDGRLFPKHCWLVSVLAAPFYGLAGNAGLWLFNQAALFLLFCGMYTMARKMMDRSWALVACLLAAIGTTLVWKNSYAFGYDLFGTACLFSGLALAGRLPLWGGFVMALSLYVRIPNAVFLAFLIAGYACFSHGGTTRWWIRLGFGLATGVFPLLIYNIMVFRSPVAGAYGSLESFVAGKAVSDSVTHYFSPAILLGHWQTRLLNFRDGLLITQPVYWLFPLVAAGFLRKELRRVLALWTLGAVSFVLLMLSFSYWEGSGGDRFVLPVSVLLCLLITLGCREMFGKSGKPGNV